MNSYSEIDLLAESIEVESYLGGVPKWPLV